MLSLLIFDKKTATDNKNKRKNELIVATRNKKERKKNAFKF